MAIKSLRTSSYFLSYVGSFLFIFKFIYFIFGCVGSLLLPTGFLQLQRVGATLRCGTWASHCGGLSCCGAWALGVQASVVAARGLSSCGLRALERRLSSCGARPQLLHGMWDLPRSGIEPVSPALAGELLTTVPPGKSLDIFLSFKILYVIQRTLKHHLIFTDKEKCQYDFETQSQYLIYSLFVIYCQRMLIAIGACYVNLNCGEHHTSPSTNKYLMVGLRRIQEKYRSTFPFL